MVNSEAVLQQRLVLTGKIGLARTQYLAHRVALSMQLADNLLL